MFGFGWAADLGDRIWQTSLRIRTGSLTSDWTDDDLAELIRIARDVSTPEAQCAPEWLLGVSWVEGRGARADAKNPHSSATGMIQWMGDKGADGVRRYFGHTRDAFCALGISGQLPYARQRFGWYKGSLATRAQVYVSVFMPKFVKAARDHMFVIAAEDSTEEFFRNAFIANRYFDKGGNNDGKIQVWELDAAIAREVKAGGARCQELFARLADVERCLP